MPKQKITISLDSEIAKKLRMDSIEKYGHSRSLSRLIEDLATGESKNDGEQPAACSLLGHRSEYSFKAEAEFKKAVEEATKQLKDIKVDKYWPSECDFSLAMKDAYQKSEFFFVMKEACELRLNEVADRVNDCWSCDGLNGPLPKYKDAGRNFELYAMLKNDLR